MRGLNGLLAIAAGTFIAMVAGIPACVEAGILAVSWDGSAYRINESTGQGALIGSTGFLNLNSMARNSSGAFYSVGGSAHNALISIAPDTGRGTFVATLNVADIRGLAFSRSDVLYAIVNGGGFGNTTVPDDLYTINVGSGVATPIGNTGMPGIQALAASPSGILYGYDTGSGSGFGLGLVTISPTTGVATDVNPNVGGSADAVQTLAFGPNGTLYGARSSLYTIDTTTGVATLVGSGGYSDVRGMEFIPEPSTLVLLGIGAIGLLAYAWRRRRS